MRVITAAGLLFVARMPLRAKIAKDKMTSSATPSSSSLESKLSAAIEQGKVPQAVVFAASRDGAYFGF